MDRLALDEKIDYLTKRAEKLVKEAPIKFESRYKEILENQAEADLML